MTTEINSLTVSWLDDTFDIVDSDDDDVVNEDSQTTFDDYYEDYDFDQMKMCLDEEEMAYDENTSSSNETNSTQNKSHSDGKVTDHVSSTNDTVTDSLFTLEDEYDKNADIPIYVQNLNVRFNELLRHLGIANNTDQSSSMQDFLQLAIVKHRIEAKILKKQIWILYLQAGTGLLQTKYKIKRDIHDRRIWFEPILKMASFRTHATHSQLSIDQQQQQQCEMIVNETLQNMNESLEKQTVDYQTMKQRLCSLTDEIEAAIDRFVHEQSLAPIRMKLNHELETLEYEYIEQLLQRAFSQLKPTEYQLEIADKLCALRTTYRQAKYNLIELKKQIFYQKPTEAVHTKALSMQSTSQSDTHEEQASSMNLQSIIDQEEKQLQENMTDIMMQWIVEAEEKVNRSRTLLSEAIQHVSVHDEYNTMELNGPMIDIIYQRFQIIDKKHEEMANFRVNYMFQHHYDDVEDVFNLPGVRFLPTIIADTALHVLDHEHLMLLHRGPTYVPPHQSYVSSSYNSEDERVNQQYKLLQHEINVLCTTHNVNVARSMFINREVKQAYIEAFSISLPTSMYRRALYEKQLVQTIQNQLTAYNLILRRTADQSNVFYLTNKTDFDDLCTKYLLNTDSIEFCETIHDDNIELTRQYLHGKIKDMNEQFYDMFADKKSREILQRIFVNESKVQLPYLYFLPNVSQRLKHRVISVKPIVVPRQCPTSRLAKFLDDLLRPIIDNRMHGTNLKNGMDFLRKFNNYIDERPGQRLHTNTIFVTMNVADFHTMIPHGILLCTLDDFFRDHFIDVITDNITKSKMIRLTAIFLHYNRFYYDNKIYRFTRGGPSSFPFVETLANMYLFQWQKLLLKQPFMRNEFFGRYKNRIFFTWTESIPELRSWITKMHAQNTDMHIDIRIGREVQFLNMSIKQEQGILHTRIVRDSHVQKYTLPYVCDDSKTAHSHWLRSSLVRAVRYCTNVEDFHRERIYLEVTCLANGYSLDFIEKRIDHFYNHFDANQLRTVLDQDVYRKLRLRLFNFMSEQNAQLAQHRTFISKNLHARLSYIYEYGSKRKFHEQLRKILLNHLNSSSHAQKVNLLFKSKHQYSLNALLSRQKPCHQLLNDKLA